MTVHNVAVKLRRVGTTQNSPCRRRNGLKNALSTLLMGVICTLPFFQTLKLCHHIVPFKYSWKFIVLTFKSLNEEIFSIHKNYRCDNKWRQVNNAFQAPNNSAYSDGGTKL